MAETDPPLLSGSGVMAISKRLSDVLLSGTQACTAACAFPVSLPVGMSAFLVGGRLVGISAEVMLVQVSEPITPGAQL